MDIGVPAVTRGGSMGFFGTKKVKFVPMGLLMGYECPCGRQNSVGDVLPLLEDENVSGYQKSDLAKCGACGAVFVCIRGSSDQGKIVGTARSYAKERAAGIVRS
jgi:hypothetical protein